MRVATWILAVASLVAAGWWWNQSVAPVSTGASAEDGISAGVVGPAVVPPPPTPAPGDESVVVADTETGKPESGDSGEAAGVVELPDGSLRPALNGVVGAPKITWDHDRPWAPIVEVRRFEDGFDWFVHADGSRSTTRYFFRSDLGREDATSITDHPHVGSEPVRVEGGAEGVPARPVQDSSGTSQ